LSLHDGRMTRRVLIGLDPLRENRGFRLLFFGQLIGVAGGQLAAVAVPYQVYLETRSSLQIGLVGLAQLVPLMLGALLGGALGDVFDRRRILAVCSVAVACCTGALALIACAAHPQIAVLYLACALNAGFGGALSAVCGAALPALVEPHRLVAANAVMQVVDQVGMVAAPALAGLLIAAIALPWIYALAAAAYLVMAPILARMPRLDVASAEAPAGNGGDAGEPEVRLSTFLRETVGGLRYLKGRQLIQGAFLIDLNAMVFGMPKALFPALAITVYGGGAGLLGCLYAAPAAGALLGAMISGWLERIRRQARAVIAAVCCWGGAITLFGLVHDLWVALPLLALAGWADVVSAVLRGTILQRSVDDSHRGRIAALQIAVVEGGPRLGDLEAGAVAALSSTGFSVVSGGLACIAGALTLGALLPGFRRDAVHAPVSEAPAAPAPVHAAD
jgi:predicted MFS family arabinose efflux permease